MPRSRCGPWPTTTSAPASTPPRLHHGAGEGDDKVRRELVAFSRFVGVQRDDDPVGLPPCFPHRGRDFRQVVRVGPGFDSRRVAPAELFPPKTPPIRPFSPLLPFPRAVLPPEPPADLPFLPRRSFRARVSAPRAPRSFPRPSSRWHHGARD